MKFDLGWKHYGRYVDDFFVVATESELSQLKIKEGFSFMGGGSEGRGCKLRCEFELGT